MLNAIAHKNYAAMVPIQIKVFKDHMDIANDCVFPENWTVDTLLGPHRSRPYNPLIAYTFFRAGYIESWGRGIQKIKESCEGSDNEFPEYSVSSDEISVRFIALGENVGRNVGQKTRQEKILTLIENDDKITKAEIAEVLNVSEKTVERLMKDIPNLKFAGRGKNGHWELL